MTKEIELTGGKVSVVDDCDYEKLIKHKWYTNPSGYAVRNSLKAEGKCRHTVKMHRQILGLKYKDGKITDHINRLVRDNRRKNLRVVDKSGNAHNHGIVSTNTSGHTGVMWHKGHKRWQAYIFVNNKQIFLGYFKDINDAVVTRRRGELEHWGECHAP